MNCPVRILFFADASSVHTRRWVAAAVERGAEAIVITRQPGDVPGAKEVIAIEPGNDKLTCSRPCLLCAAWRAKWPGASSPRWCMVITSPHMACGRPCAG